MSILARKHINFTSGNIILQLVQFSIPIVLGELLQNLYSTVDSLFVGNYVGKTALAAISECSSISLLLIGFFNGMSAGIIALVSRAFGKGDREELELTKRIVLTVSVVIGVSLSILGMIFARGLIMLTGAEGELFDQALIYLRIYLLGLMFTVIYNMLSGILRGIGDSVTPLRILMLSTCINIGADWAMLSIFNMGIAGAAWATIFSQGISVILAYATLRKGDTSFRLSFPELKPNRGIIKNLFSIGLPSGLQNSLISISNLFVWRYINSFGVTVSAGVGVGHKLDKFVSMPCKSFGLTMTGFISQNAGAGNHKRNKEGGIKCFILSVVVTMTLGAIVYMAAPFLCGLFNDDTEVISVGVAMMRTIIPTYFLICIRECLLGILRGYGRTRTPMYISLFGMIVVRQVYLAIAYATNPVANILYRCYPVAWTATSGLLLIYFLVVRKKLHPEAETV